MKRAVSQAAQAMREALARGRLLSVALVALGAPSVLAVVAARDSFTRNADAVPLLFAASPKVRAADPGPWFQLHASGLGYVPDGSGFTEVDASQVSALAPVLARFAPRWEDGKPDVRLLAAGNLLFALGPMEIESDAPVRSARDWERTAADDAGDGDEDEGGTSLDSGPAASEGAAPPGVPERATETAATVVRDPAPPAKARVPVLAVVGWGVDLPASVGSGLDNEIVIDEPEVAVEAGSLSDDGSHGRKLTGTLTGPGVSASTGHGVAVGAGVELERGYVEVPGIAGTADTFVIIAQSTFEPIRLGADGRLLGVRGGLVAALTADNYAVGSLASDGTSVLTGRMRYHDLYEDFQRLVQGGLVQVEGTSPPQLRVDYDHFRNPSAPNPELDDLLQRRVVSDPKHTFVRFVRAANDALQHDRYAEVERYFRVSYKTTLEPVVVDGRVAICSLQDPVRKFGEPVHRPVAPGEWRRANAEKRTELEARASAYAATGEHAFGFGVPCVHARQQLDKVVALDPRALQRNLVPLTDDPDAPGAARGTVFAAGRTSSPWLEYVPHDGVVPSVPVRWYWNEGMPGGDETRDLEVRPGTGGLNLDWRFGRGPGCAGDTACLKLRFAGSAAGWEVTLRDADGSVASPCAASIRLKQLIAGSAVAWSSSDRLTLTCGDQTTDLAPKDVPAVPVALATPSSGTLSLSFVRKPGEDLTWVPPKASPTLGLQVGPRLELLAGDGDDPTWLSVVPAAGQSGASPTKLQFVGGKVVVTRTGDVSVTVDGRDVEGEADLADRSLIDIGWHSKGKPTKHLQFRYHDPRGVVARNTEAGLRDYPMGRSFAHLVGYLPAQVPGLDAQVGVDDEEMTIEADLQGALQGLLDGWMGESDARYPSGRLMGGAPRTAAILLMNYETGDVLAGVDYPTFEPDRPGFSAVWENREIDPKWLAEHVPGGRGSPEYLAPRSWAKVAVSAEQEPSLVGGGALTSVLMKHELYPGSTMKALVAESWLEYQAEEQRKHEKGLDQTGGYEEHPERVPLTCSASPLTARYSSKPKDGTTTVSEVTEACRSSKAGCLWAFTGQPGQAHLSTAGGTLFSSTAKPLKAVHCAHAHDLVTGLADALAESCNSYFMRLRLWMLGVKPENAKGDGGVRSRVFDLTDKDAWAESMWDTDADTTLDSALAKDPYYDALARFGFSQREGDFGFSAERDRVAWDFKRRWHIRGVPAMQLFSGTVPAVRRTGGNASERRLLLQAYGDELTASPFTMAAIYEWLAGGRALRPNLLDRHRATGEALARESLVALAPVGQAKVLMGLSGAATGRVPCPDREERCAVGATAGRLTRSPSPFPALSNVIYAKTGTPTPGGPFIDPESGRMVERADRWLISFVKPTKTGPPLLLVVYLSDKNATATEKLPDGWQAIPLAVESWRVIDRYYGHPWN